MQLFYDYFAAILRLFCSYFATFLQLLCSYAQNGFIAVLGCFGVFWAAWFYLYAQLWNSLENCRNGNLANHWIDSLQAAFPGVQALYGDLDEAICHHATYFAIWKKYGCLPERFNWKLNGADVKFYPLRPEFIESTYLLYQATKNPFYLHVGKEILTSLNQFTKGIFHKPRGHNFQERSERSERSDN